MSDINDDEESEVANMQINLNEGDYLFTSEIYFVSGSFYISYAYFTVEGNNQTLYSTSNDNMMYFMSSTSTFKNLKLNLTATTQRNSEL